MRLQRINIIFTHEVFFFKTPRNVAWGWKIFCSPVAGYRRCYNAQTFYFRHLQEYLIRIWILCYHLFSNFSTSFRPKLNISYETVSPASTLFSAKMEQRFSGLPAFSFTPSLSSGRFVFLKFRLELFCFFHDWLFGGFPRKIPNSAHRL